MQVNSVTQLFIVFLVGAFISTSIHHLISYLARRKKPLRFVFFLWIALVISIAIRFYTLLTGAESAYQPFILQILEMAVMACMSSHLTYNEAARYIRYIIPVSLTAVCLYWAFPKYLVLILGVAQLMSYFLIGYLTYQLYLQKKPYFNLLLGATVVALLAFTFFSVGPVGLGFHYPVPARVMLLAFYLISFILHATYLNRMSALTSQKFVESEFITTKLKELDHLKTKFFSNITHEFRTPLTLIQGPATELLEKTNDPEAKKLLEMIKNNSARLLKLINQLLDLARLDAHEVKLNYKPTRLDTLLKTSISQFTSLASSRGIQLEWRIPEEAGTVLIDEEKIETIVINLISNALKFTPTAGKVVVTGSFKNNVFEMEVKDNGRGIPAEKLAHIFDRFYQVEATDSSHSEGTGIGLALVKEYVELMKGVIQIESKTGVGTSIKISLTLVKPPLELPEEPTTVSKKQPTQEEETPVVNSELPLLLIVEDNEDIRAFIKTCLGLQYRYSEARHGREGLEKARHEIPDVLISDLMMPEMDGLELCHEIKKDRRTNHIPFIMLTAKAAEENKIRQSHGVQDLQQYNPHHRQTSDGRSLVPF